MNQSWEDIPDTPQYSETVDWEYNTDIEDLLPDKQQAPPTTIATVSEKMGAIIYKACTTRLDYADRMKARNTYSLPKVAASRTPQLDNFIKMEIQPATKAADKELAVIQSHVLDALAPLSAILETKDDVPEETMKVATDAIKLLGNASARISHLRRTKVITQVNKTLLPLVEDDSNFVEVSPSLFGPEFAQKSKDLVDQVKAMRSTLNAPSRFFDQAPPTARGVMLASRLEEEPRKDEQTREGHSRRTLGTSDSRTHNFKNGNNELETYLSEPDCTSRGSTVLSTRPAAGRQVGTLSGKLVITQDQWVLNMVRGYHIDFVALPHQESRPTLPHYSTEQVTLIQEEISKLLQKQAIQPVECPSKLQHIPSAQKGWWAKTCHQPQSTEQFCAPGALQDGGNPHLLRQGDWLAKVDLKDGYFAIPIHQSHQKYLQFQFQGKTIHFTCLPFGLCSAPWVFTKTLKPALAVLHQRAVRLIG